jgi:hypothetical protein
MRPRTVLGYQAEGRHKKRANPKTQFRFRIARVPERGDSGTFRSSPRATNINLEYAELASRANMAGPVPGPAVGLYRRRVTKGSAVRVCSAASRWRSTSG